METTLRRTRWWFPLIALLVAVGAAIGLGAAPADATSTPAPTDPSQTYQFQGIVRSDPQTPLAGVVITATGDGFEGTATTGADGRWSIAVPGPGAYTVTIDEATIPSGLQVNPEHVSREFTIGTTNSQGVLFQIGEPGSFDGAGSGGDDGEGTSSGSGSGSSSGESSSSRFSWSQLGQRLFTGLNFGLLLALGAIGITLIFGTTGVNNFAHGEMLTFGALVFYMLTTALHLPVWLSVLGVLVASAAFGWLHDAAIFRPLRRRRVGLVQVLIVTIGLSIALRYFFQFLFGGGSETLAVDNSAVISFGTFNVRVSNIVSMVVSVIILLAVAFFLTRTRIGKATRAVSDNSGLAAASGINVDRVIRIVWVLAGTLTGLSGVLYAYFVGASVRWDMGFIILLLLFASVTLGGLGSAFGALVGAVIIGLATELSTLWLPTDLRFAVALVILILVLLLRPQGVLGRKERIG
ncbi:branched-chain amino acid ABC transporter permease [Agrococcus sp. SGAir0287]|uniref:branched-chain amino acid ABC transporter permease n=1 Tax=Agrococcus sp. SGAir0287 TaxID=2070347 RepID=UPI0020C75C87|nr:branched-chain amino acid ABC transporter permease [Agrococcus sp. SGAir0287]